MLWQRIFVWHTVKAASARNFFPHISHAIPAFPLWIDCACAHEWFVASSSRTNCSPHSVHVCRTFSFVWKRSKMWQSICIHLDGCINRLRAPFAYVFVIAELNVFSVYIWSIRRWHRLHGIWRAFSTTRCWWIPCRIHGIYSSLSEFRENEFREILVLVHYMQHFRISLHVFAYVAVAVSWSCRCIDNLNTDNSEDSNGASYVPSTRRMC